ncbi:HEAT repeat domain-containing protein [Streptomyces sp. NPDC004267]|uniref:HEAT repeat domain-containing protein n=1 Tax=Streptomyces sp. NPDC004267 TaxID=3364694 RepID=UPI0036B1A60E
MLIGEVAQRSGVSARMLRHYEKLGLVRPSGRTGSGYREYSGEDVRRIFHIESLRSLGLSLREIGLALDDPGFTPSALVADLIRQTRERIAAETELLTRLSRIDAAEPTDWTDVLKVVELLHALASPNADTRQRAALNSATPAAPADETPVPVEALVDAVLGEPDPNVAGALRWALARSGDDSAPGLLAQGLGSPDAGVRKRAVQTLAELPGERAGRQLRDALGHTDGVVRRYAALALGARGVADAIPTLVDVIVEGSTDTDAADALSTLASDPASDTPAADPIADRIAAGLVDRLARPGTTAAARGRLTQALAGIPGPTASRALAELSRDEDRAVALTATYLLHLHERDGR